MTFRDDKTERLQKVLAKAGIASRRHAETLIAQGRVMVNGEKVTTPGMKFDPLQDHIKVDGKHIPAQKKNAYLLVNKPLGMITSVRDPEGRPTVMQLVPKEMIKDRLFPVGRLDYNTEGLLLLTNDGEMANKLIHPRYGIKKKYWVKVKGVPTEGQLKRLEGGGIRIGEEESAPCKVRPLKGVYPTPVSENSWFEMTLREGKKREVRRLMEDIGHPVLKLKRVAFANLILGSLPTGATRLLTPKEIDGLKKVVGAGCSPPPPPKKSSSPAKTGGRGNR